MVHKSSFERRQEIMLELLLLTCALLVMPSRSVDNAVQIRKDGWPTCELGGSYDIQHKMYCDRYFTCQEGQLYLRQCEDGLGYIPYKGCKILHWVNCTGREKLQSPQGSGDCLRLYGIHPHPSGCSKYLQCHNGTATTQQCANNLIFDIEKKTCRPARPLEMNVCSVSISQSPDFHCPIQNYFPFGDHSRHAHPGSCIFFIMCLRDGTQKTGSCQPGKAFSPITKNCESRNEVPNC